MKRRPPGTLGVNNPVDPQVLVDYRRHFFAMVTGVDMAIGRIIERLKEQGQYEDTLIIFNSDHGDLNGDHGGTSKGPNWYEGVMHLPWVMSWPKVLGTEGRRISGLVEMVDVLPSMLGLSELPNSSNDARQELWS